jgi:hypothetical protein
MNQKLAERSAGRRSRSTPTVAALRCHQFERLRQLHQRHQSRYRQSKGFLMLEDETGTGAGGAPTAISRDAPPRAGGVAHPGNPRQGRVLRAACHAARLAAPALYRAEWLERGTG